MHVSRREKTQTAKPKQKKKKAHVIPWIVPLKGVFDKDAGQKHCRPKLRWGSFRTRLGLTEWNPGSLSMHMLFNLQR